MLGYSGLTIADPTGRRSLAREEKRLRDFAAVFTGQHVESIVEVGDAASVIHKVVQHRGADLVMLPTHGRAGQ